jgi:hypothetical protein
MDSILELESKFFRFNKLNNQVQINFELQFESVKANISNRVQDIEKLVEKTLNETRESLIHVLKDDLDEHLSNIGLLNRSIAQMRTVNAQLNTMKADNLLSNCNLLGSLYYKNEFRLKQKIVYLNLFHRFESLVLNKCPDGYKIAQIIPLNGSKIFYSFKSSDYTKDLIQICTKNGAVLSEKLITLGKRYFTKYSAFNKHVIVCLNNFCLNDHYLKLLDEKLNVLSTRQFKFLINLVCLKLDELICYKPHEYMIFNLKLEQLRSIDLKRDILQHPITSLVEYSLIDSNESFLFFLVKHLDERKLFIQLFCKKTLQLIYKHEINTNDSFQADHSGLFLKQARSFKYIQLDSRTIRTKQPISVCSSSNPICRYFPYFNLTQDNFVYFVNFYSNKIYLF